MLFPGISPALMCLGALCVLATKTGCCEIAFAFIDHGGLPTYPKPNRLQTPLIMMAVIILWLRYFKRPKIDHQVYAVLSRLNKKWGKRGWC